MNKRILSLLLLLPMAANAGFFEDFFNRKSVFASKAPNNQISENDPQNILLAKTACKEARTMHRLLEDAMFDKSNQEHKIPVPAQDRKSLFNEYETLFLRMFEACNSRSVRKEDYKNNNLNTVDQEKFIKANFLINKGWGITSKVLPEVIDHLKMTKNSNIKE